MEEPMKICGICGVTGSNLLSSLKTLKTKYSGTCVYDLLERMAEYEQCGLAIGMADNAACNECYSKVNDYDAANTKALIIQKELLDVMKQSSEEVVKDLEVMDFGEHEEEMDNDFQQQLQHSDEQEGVETCFEQGGCIPDPGPVEFSLSNNVCLKCTTCGEQFNNLNEMQAHKHNTVTAESKDADSDVPDLIIEYEPASPTPLAPDSVDELDDNSQHSGGLALLEEHSGDLAILEEYPGDLALLEEVDSEAEEYIIEVLDGEDETIESDTEEKLDPKPAMECYYCDEYFSHRQSFKEHMEKAHSSCPGRHKCKTCGFVAKTRSALCNHFFTHSRPSVTCHICNREFQHKATLQRHMVIHSRKTSYHCNVCEKGYIHYSSFYMHQLVHKDLRLKKCHICGFELRSSSHLTRHMRTHSGEKPFSCPECGQKFSERYNMVAHLNGHRGITRKSAKTYVCQLCSKAGPEKMKLRRHLQVDHGLSDETEMDQALLLKVFPTVSTYTIISS